MANDNPLEKNLKKNDSSLEKKLSQEIPANKESENIVDKVRNSLTTFKDYLLYGDPKSNQVAESKQNLKDFEQMIRAQVQVKELEQFNSEFTTNVKETVSGSYDLLKELKQETLPMVALYQGFHKPLGDLTIKLGNTKVVTLMNDILKAGLNFNDPADRGRIVSVLDLLNNVPYVIANLLV